MVKTFHKNSFSINFEKNNEINASNTFLQLKTRFCACDNKRLKSWFSVHLAFDAKGVNVLTLAAWNAGAGPAWVGTCVLRCFRLPYVLPANTCHSLRNQDFAVLVQLQVPCYSLDIICEPDFLTSTFFYFLQTIDFTQKLEEFKNNNFENCFCCLSKQ